MKLQKTFTPRPADVDRSWWLVDATDLPLGRLASEVAYLLRGKHKPTFAPHMDMGDYVIVVNAAKVAVTGAKADAKNYYHHSGYPGGLTATTLTEMLATHPERVVEKAVRGGNGRRATSNEQRARLSIERSTTQAHAAGPPHGRRCGPVPRRSPGSRPARSGLGRCRPIGQRATAPFDGRKR